MPKEVVDLDSKRGHVHWPTSGVFNLWDKTEKLRLYDLYAELLALQPEELSRYLRESKFIMPFAIEFLAAMLDPTGDTTWKLAFSRRRRGKPSPSENKARLYSIGKQVETALIGACKVENAVEDVAKEFRISRATAYRGLKFYRKRSKELAKLQIEYTDGLISEKLWRLS